MILPRQVRSGSTPNRRLRAAGDGAEARDHLVEDQQDAVRACSDRAGPRRNPSAGGTTPMLPAIGSTMMRRDLTRLCAASSASTDARSL